MAKNTEISLRNKVIYSVYVRNHTNDGTFNAVAEDLDRIKSLGTDIIWFMPIHPIGVKNKKGSLGCPYANKDYRTTNPEYGTMDDFKSLVEKIHAKGMKCIIDVVYNHTSPDSNLSVEHPEFFYRKPDGNFGNKVGDWSDIIDLDYSNKELWQYQIDSLVMWAKIVDGFRCDVASFVPVEFWKQAREAVAKVNPDCIWLAESVHSSFNVFSRKSGIYTASDYELFDAFDMLVEHNLRLVAHIIKKYYGTQSEQDDLVSIGTIGLIKAINTFDMNKNIKLSSYASRCIENEILMHFRNAKKSAQDISLNETIDTDKDGNPLTLLDIMSVDDNIIDNLDLKLNSKKLGQFIKEELNEREQKIIVLRYGLDGKEALTQKSVAKMLGISRSYVSRIETKALKQLRKRFETSSNL